MIHVNNILIPTLSRFQDGTSALKVQPEVFVSAATNGANIRWNYSGDDEAMILLYLAKYFRAHGVSSISLDMPYVPNARMDRIEENRDVFTLKYFTQFINSLNFDRVRVFDPHSRVVPALITNCVVCSAEEYIQKTIEMIDKDGDLCAFFPDVNAAKKYAGMTGLDSCYAIKTRDWSSGKIISTFTVTDKDLLGRPVIIIDDICSSGETIRLAAEKLKETHKKIYVYCSHTENESLFGSLMRSSDLIDGFFTTDSIFAARNAPEFINVFHWE